MRITACEASHLLSIVVFIIKIIVNDGKDEIKEEICQVDIFNVVHRTSSTFTALIYYNCSWINPSELSIWIDKGITDNCHINEDDFDNNAINVTCNSIENNAGQNWTFTIGGNYFHYYRIFLNKTLTVTLTPLSLNISTNLIMQMNDYLISASITISDCLNITNVEYLMFRCNASDLSKTIVSDNCTYTCSNLESDSIYNASLIRLPIPIADKNSNTFPEEILPIIYRTDLNKATNLSFDENSTSILFDRPSGFYDEIFLYCSEQDQYCSNNSFILSNNTGNCSTCTSIVLSSITRGVSYKCYAITMKEGFANVSSDELIFNTLLQPVILNGSSQYWSNQFIFNITMQSDFDHIQSVCSITQNETFPCSNLTVDHEQCSTVLIHHGIRGCDYRCYFITKKLNYVDIYSINYSIQLLPPKPNLFVPAKDSRFISIQWTFNEPVFVRFYRIYLDERLIDTLNNNISSYDYTDLLPNQEYRLDIHVISGQSVISETVFVKTFEEAPPIPSDDNIKKKIIPLTNDIETTTEQYAIEIDLSLFSNQYGQIYFYRIYVRQDLNKTTTKLDLIGTYAAAMINQSLDYLAFVIPLSSLSSSTLFFWRSNSKLKIILGTETSCQDDFNVSIPCNGKLNIDRTYKIVVSACANPGCTSVLSKAFRTTKIFPIPSKSKNWFLTFPILFVFILIGLIIWKRNYLKIFYYKKVQQLKKMNETSITYRRKESSISLSATVCQIRPKLLIEYINLTHANEKAIYMEYKQLENIHLQDRQSISEFDYGVYNRYTNISARGTWNRTAIRLTGEHRRHDYINANQIKSYDNKKEYIACQGPLQETCEDFWDMIIQYRVSTIVMLTKTDEPNLSHPQISKSKCYQYFPNNLNETLIFGRITIKVVDIEFYHNSDLEIRHIYVKETDGIEHHVIHYYYTGWPDYNVVQPKILLYLIEYINNHREYSLNSHQEIRSKLSSPTVVHCSAGVGRTGTYIAVETIMRLLDCSNEELLNMKLDVMGIVHQLRRDRGKMVQTKEQYMLINRCVKQYLQLTGRVDLILRRSNINEKVISSKRNPVNISRPINRISSLSSNIDPYVHHMSNTTHRTISSQSNRPIHEVHRERRLTYHHPTTHCDQTLNSINPPIPPRCSRRTNT